MKRTQHSLRDNGPPKKTAMWRYVNVVGHHRINRESDPIEWKILKGSCSLLEIVFRSSSVIDGIDTDHTLKRG